MKRSKQPSYFASASQIKMLTYIRWAQQNRAFDFEASIKNQHNDENVSMTNDRTR